jgi:hypothetical protein
VAGVPILSGTMPRVLPSQSRDLNATMNNSFTPLLRRNSALAMHLFSSQPLIPSCCTSGGMGTVAPVPTRRHMSVNEPIFTTSPSCFHHSSGNGSCCMNDFSFFFFQTEYYHVICTVIIKLCYK